MKVIVIDRDEVASQLISSKITQAGHQVVVEPDKNVGLQKLYEEPHHLVVIDPSPVSDVRQVISNVRKAVGHYAYVALLSDSFDRETAMRAGANDILNKPVSSEALDGLVDCSKSLTDLIARIGDSSEDFLSAGGVIAKSAFNQLFLSGIDRADRYGERTFVLFISLKNYQDLYEGSGSYAADFAVAKLCQHLVRIRRQSDIIGQTAKSEYALLLQRPMYETEPLDAAKRFAASMGDLKSVAQEILTSLTIEIKLIDLPVGEVHVLHEISVSENEA